MDETGTSATSPNYDKQLESPNMDSSTAKSGISAPQPGGSSSAFLLDPAIKTGTIHRPNNIKNGDAAASPSQFDIMSGNDTSAADDATFYFDNFLGLACEIHPDKKSTVEIWSKA
jgi:hypothetical protein